VSDYNDRVREFAQLNPDQYVPDTEYPLVFQAVTRQIEDDNALGERVMYDLTLGENVGDVLRSPTAPHEPQVPDQERYAESRMAAVTWRARAAQRAAAGADLQDWQRRFGIPPDRDRAVALGQRILTGNHDSDCDEQPASRQGGGAVSTRRQLHEFVRLNPEYAPQAARDGRGQFRPRPLVRELGTSVALALVDENHGTLGEHAAAVAERATLAQQRGEACEARLEERFARLNPEFGVLPSRTDRDQQRFAQGRERALALGSRVHLAEARENSGSPELAAWLIRERALRAGRLARDERPVQPPTTERARAAAER
jgi:hypothetical protein